jgi:hypothetical protein
VRLILMSVCEYGRFGHFCGGAHGRPC